MTVEEAFVTLLAVVAGVMLFLGLAQALDDRSGRRERRGPLPLARLGRRPFDDEDDVPLTFREARWNRADWAPDVDESPNGSIHIPPVMSARPTSIEDVAPAVAEHAPAMTTRAPVVTERAVAATGAVPAVTDVAPAATDLSPAVTERAPTVTARTPAVTGFDPTATDVTAPVNERATAVTEVAPTTTKLGAGVTEGSSAVTDTAPAVTEIATTVNERGPAVTERAPAMTVRAATTTDLAAAGAERGLATTDLTPAVTGHDPSMTKRASVVAERASAVTDLAPAMTDRAPTTPELSSAVPEGAQIGFAPTTTELAPTVPERVPAMTRRRPTERADVALDVRPEPSATTGADAVRGDQARRVRHDRSRRVRAETGEPVPADSAEASANAPAYANNADRRRASAARAEGEQPVAAPHARQSVQAPTGLATAPAISDLIVRHDFAEARRRIAGAVDAGEMSADRAEALFEELRAALREEVGRLTGGAIRGGKDEARDARALDEARAILDSMPTGSLPASERAALVRRVWQAQAKLGFRRLGQGQLDLAVDALFSALAMRDIGPRRQRQVRDALVRTLEGMAGERVAKVGALLAEGKGVAAAESLAGIEECIGRARAEGVPPEELEVALVRARQLASAIDAEGRRDLQTD